ncbi:MAG: hypothetical protein BAJATHORv1_20206 [Candidatus Thorarchaeota archaeon]|nr:MAG: hypothetical protein BAJATHORv1_20206 [Candidatus Thorarchaeota archaeon]
MKRDDEFKEAFPAISEEMRSGKTQTHKIDGVRTMSEEEETQQTRFTPDVVDYLRRCDTISQAEEIVKYLLKQGEISNSEAKAIRSQLKTQGLRSFGEKKKAGHYMHHGLE